MRLLQPGPLLLELLESAQPSEVEEKLLVPKKVLYGTAKEIQEERREARMRTWALLCAGVLLANDGILLAYNYGKHGTFFPPAASKEGDPAETPASLKGEAGNVSEEQKGS